ncbi:hypothetical protein [Streptomyces sp. HPF1205]|uniref:hypothetical protein n=1 Tax=Streptomyces sp. HPF1205 TaxID=2873262 RepID=UPI001CEC0225|nr:hypothetical protein [Streptomyces sp. HPF1205]
MRSLKGAVFAATAVAALSLAACGPLGSGTAKGSGPAGAPSAAAGGHGTVVQAVQALDLVRADTGKVHSATGEITMRVGTTMSATAKGDIDWSRGLEGQLTMNVTGGKAAQAIRGATGQSTVVARYLPGAYYANMGQKAAGLLGGKHWIRYGYADLARITGQSGTAIQDAFQSDNPVRSVDLALASGDLRQVGTETVRGVPATHYRGTVDVMALARQDHPHLSASDLAGVRAMLRKKGVTSERVDLWVTADHLPVKVVTHARTKKGDLDTTVYYSHFGVAVHVQAPPASDCVNFTDLAGSTPTKA